MSRACSDSGSGSPPVVLSRGVWPVVLWAALLFAFAPTLVDGFELLRMQPWTRAGLVFPVLAFLAAREDSAAEPSRSGWVLIGIGVIVQLMAIAGEFVRAGRIGFVLAAIGLCRGTGGCSLSVALLLGFLLPVPGVLVALGSPWLESGLADAAARLASTFGFPVVHRAEGLASPDSILPLSPHDGGLGLVAVFAGLAWFSAQRAPGRSWVRMAGLGAVFVLAAAGAQLLTLTSSAIALAAGGIGSATTARAILDQTPWILTWASGIVLACTLRRPEGAGERS